MAVLLLVRHGTTDDVGVAVSGRAPGVHLNGQGEREVHALDERLADVALAAVYASPLERALETAAPLAARRGLQVRHAPGVNELAYGEWTGRRLVDLADDPRWRSFNAVRSRTRIPGGELIVETQARAVAACEAIAAAHPDATVAVVTHADVIRAALVHWLGMPLDLMLRIEIAPASVSTVELGRGDPRVLGIDCATAFAR